MANQYSEMSQAEIDEFLQVPRHAVVGTNRVNGPPQLTPVWYLYENEKIYISMFVESAKYKNLRRDPRVSICIAGESPDARAVIFSGTVELFLEGNTTWVDEIIWRLVRRYFDSDKEAQLYVDSEDIAAESALAVVFPRKNNSSRLQLKNQQRHNKWLQNDARKAHVSDPSHYTSQTSY